MRTKLQIDIQTAKVAEFCRRYRIRELSLFGSVLRDDFRADSDVDVLVDFEPDAPHSLFDLARMEEELSALLGRKVDLVERPGLRNPFRRYEILRTRQVIFAV
jgi:predicted nucleotidyltransferase